MLLGSLVGECIELDSFYCSLSFDLLEISEWHIVSISHKLMESSLHW
jgi:hypothetical protein